MTAIQELENEHEAVKITISILEKITETLVQNPTPQAVDHLVELIEFFDVFVDRCHHGKEEKFLFPALINTGVSKETGPIGVLLTEHEKGRRYVEQLNAGIPQLKKADTAAAKQVEIIAKSYAALMSQHMEKEDTILFPLADDRLSENEQNDLYERFEHFEQETIGAGRHERFHQMIDRLSSIY